jgi:hypothetical protein
MVIMELSIKASLNLTVVNPIAGFEWDMVMRTSVPQILLEKDRSALVARERGEL